MICFETSLTRDNSESKKLELPLQMSSPYHGTSFLSTMLTWTYLDILGRWSKSKTKKVLAQAFATYQKAAFCFSQTEYWPYGHLWVYNGIYLTWFNHLPSHKRFIELPWFIPPLLQSDIHWTVSDLRPQLRLGSLLHILQTNYIKHTWHDIKHIIEIQSWCT